MAIPPQLLLAAARMLKNRKSPTAQIKEALAPAVAELKGPIADLTALGAEAGFKYNTMSEDPSMRTGITTSGIAGAARGFQSNGITGLITGGIMGGVTGAIATGNAKEQKAEQDKYTYLNQMYSSVVGADTDLQSALMYAEDGGEIVSAEGETFVPIQTEAKVVDGKLVKEKLIFSDGKIADVNATKPHSEQKKDDVTDITVEGTYVMPVSTKLSKKDLDSLISYSTSNYSENGKNFAVEKVTLRDILGEKFEGSFAEATDIITKKYPVMDTDDDLDPIARITNNENIANRSKIVAHLMRLNEAKINKEPIEEVKLTPSMKAKSGGYIQKYVLGSTVAGDPPKKRKMNINEFPFLEKVGMTPAESTARAFHEDSLNSEGYKKRIKKSAPSGYTAAEKEQYAKDVINDRRLNLRATKNKGLGVSAPTNIGEYRGWDESIGFNESGLNDTQVNTHELSHATTMGMENFLYDDAMRMDKKINTYENRDKKGETRIMSPQYYDYLRTPTEVKARLDVLKQYAAKKGIVKIGEDITPAKMDDLINKIYNDESIEVEEVYYHYEDLLQILKEDKKNSKQDTLGKLWNEIADSNGKMKPLIVAKKGGFVSQYVLKPNMSLKKGGYIRKMEEGGGVGDPPKGKKYVKKTGETIIVGEDKKIYWKGKDGSYKEADPRIGDSFKSEISNKSATGSISRWRLLSDDTPKEAIKSDEYKKYYDYWKGNAYDSEEKLKKELDRLDSDKKNNIPIIKGKPIESEAIYNAYKDKYNESVQMRSDGSSKPLDTKSNSALGVNPKDDEWISQILDFESTAGSRSGTGLKDYGIQKDKWGKKYSYLNKENLSKEDATRFIREEYISKVKDYPPDVQKRLVDYAYNTGRNIEDVLMHASGLVDTESVQTKNTDYDLFDKNKDQIIKNMQDPNFVSKIDQSKHDILKDYWTRKGTPKVYDDTSAKRINMWNTNQRPNLDIKPLDTKNLDPINSMETMDILGTPIVRSKTQVNTESPTINTKRGGDYLVQKANQELTPTDMWYPNTYTSEGSVNRTSNEQPNNVAQSDGATKYTPKGGYYIPGENKNRYDKDSEGNWYVQKNDGKTWIPASSLPNSADAIKKLNDESKPWNVSTPSKPASSSSLVKPKAKTASNAAPITKKEIENINENNSEIKSSYYRASSDNYMRNKLLNNFKETSDDDINNTINFINLAGDTAGDGSPELSAYYAKKIREEKAKRSSYNLKVTSKRKGGYVIPTKMAKGGYIKKMAGGGPIVPIIPERWRDIWAIDETGQQPYYPMPNMVNNPLYDMSPIGKISNALPSDNNPYQVGVPIGTPRDDNPYEIGKQIGTPRADSKTSTPNTGDEEVLDMYRTKISERKGDAVRDAEEAKTGYKALSKRVGMRDLMQLGKGLVGIGLQDRTERRAFKRPLYIDQKYRGLSPQQINQQAEAGTGAGVEAIKQMMNGGGDRVTARLAPILIDRLIQQQGQTRKAYVDQNTSLERAKYAERGTIQQFNLDEEARAKNEERDFNNKAISSSAQLINKYISSRSAGDIEGYKTEQGINRDLTDKLYKLDNNELQTDMIGKEYEMYMSDVRQKINDLEAQLLDPKISFDEAARKSVEYHIAKNKEELRLLEERDKKNKIRQNINGN